MSWAEDQTWFGLEPENIGVIDAIPLLQTKCWQTKDGRIIPINKMTTQHLQNSINKIVREGWRVEFLPLLKQELKNRK